MNDYEVKLIDFACSKFLKKGNKFKWNMKGGSPHNIIYINAPKDNSSLVLSYKLSITYGEQYILVMDELDWETFLQI